MRKLTVQEYAKLMNISPSTVWKRVRQCKVKHIKEEVENREVIMILVEDDESNEKLSSVREVIATKDYEECELTEENNREVALVERVMDEIKVMNQRVDEYSNRAMEYAELAGQAKLLTDSENKTKEEYFKVVQENAVLKSELNLLKDKMKEPEDKRTFWDILFKKV